MASLLSFLLAALFVTARAQSVGCAVSSPQSNAVGFDVIVAQGAGLDCPVYLLSLASVMHVGISNMVITASASGKLNGVSTVSMSVQCMDPNLCPGATAAFITNIAGSSGNDPALVSTLSVSYNGRTTSNGRFATTQVIGFPLWAAVVTSVAVMLVGCAVILAFMLFCPTDNNKF
jgi:hypothetical protein